MIYNNELSTIDTPSKAYLLGLIYADGCISKGKTTSIYLTEEDGYLLSLLQKEFPFFNLTFRHNKNQGNQKSGYVLSSNIRRIHADLILAGVVNRKSYENKEQLAFPLLERELFGSFIRGFFDGDGSAFTNSDRPNGVRVEMSCVSHRFITELKLILEELGITCLLYDRQPNGKDRKQIIYRLYIIKSSDIINFRNLIYSDNINLYLVRKKERLLKQELLIDSRKKNVLNLDREIICPLCHGKECTICGKRQMKWGLAERFKCKSCNRRHTREYQENIARFPHKRKDEEMKPIN